MMCTLTMNHNICLLGFETINPIPFFLYLELSINNSNFHVFSKKYFLHFNSFKYMENGTLPPQEQMSIFHNILKNLTFQRRPKALVWIKGLTPIITY